MLIDPEKTALNARLKAELRAHLRQKTWVEKVQAIARMNGLSKLARKAMKQAEQGQQADRTACSRPPDTAS